MRQKQIDAFRSYYHQPYDDYKNPYIEKSFSEILQYVSLCISDAMLLSEERQKINFADNYKHISEWHVYEKEDAWLIWKKYRFAALFSGLERILEVGLYESLEHNDFQILKDALHSYNRMQWAKNLYTVSGYDHTGNFFSSVYALADGDIELVKRQLPECLGLGTKKTSYTVSRVCGSAVMALVYKNDEWKMESHDMLKNLVNLKSTGKIYENIGQYLSALINQDACKANDYLKIIDNKYKSLTILSDFNRNIFKFFPIFIHGLYSLAYFSLPKSVFTDIEKPQNNFIDEFHAINQQLNFLPGKNCFALTEDTKMMEELFCF